ncbi:DUF3073 domain-containing protein [Actinomyces polynesiensis]|uniref:DUF3073 domain-containing protein n=1 Tax=Actinomyces polynesiensis TaxID=1325934 RepID=UPI0005B7A4BE|nr:DUF3073 domain-containing protein [Actinomyces polynesiensis]
MGRGRQKAKQTKVARKLKYFSPDTDLSALQRELASTHGDSGHDPYSKYAEDADEDSEDPDQDVWSRAPSGH